MLCELCSVRTLQVNSHFMASMRRRSRRVPIMEERRSNQRHRVLKAGTISFERGGTIDCQVRNLSDHGACLEVASPVGIPETFTLAIPKDSIRRPARVKWRKASRIGIAFV